MVSAQRCIFNCPNNNQPTCAYTTDGKYVTTTNCSTNGFNCANPNTRMLINIMNEFIIIKNQALTKTNKLINKIFSTNICT